MKQSTLLVFFGLGLVLLMGSLVQAELSTVWGVEKNTQLHYDRMEALSYPSSWNVENQTYSLPFNITFLEFSQDGYKFEFQDPQNKTTGITLFKDFSFFGMEGVLPLIGYPFLLPLAIYDENDYVRYYFEQWKTLAEFLESQQTQGKNVSENVGFTFLLERNTTIESLYFSFFQPNMTLASVPSDSFFGNFSLSQLNLTRVSPFNTSLTLFTNVTTTYSVAYEINTGIIIMNNFTVQASGWKLITQKNTVNESFYQNLMFIRSVGNNIELNLTRYSFGYYPLYLMIALIVIPVVYYSWKFIRGY